MDPVKSWSLTIWDVSVVVNVGPGLDSISIELYEGTDVELIFCCGPCSVGWPGIFESCELGELETCLGIFLPGSSPSLFRCARSAARR